MSRNLHLRKGKSSAWGGRDSAPDSPPMRRNWSWVIEVLVAESNRHNPSHHQRVHRGLDRLRTAPILKAGRDQLGQRQGAIDSAQQQGPGIGVDAPAAGTHCNPAPINVPRALASSDTLCQHGEYDAIEYRSPRRSGSGHVIASRRLRPGTALRRRAGCPGLSRGGRTNARPVSAARRVPGSPMPPKRDCSTIRCRRRRTDRHPRTTGRARRLMIRS